MTARTVKVAIAPAKKAAHVEETRNANVVRVHRVNVPAVNAARIPRTIPVVALTVEIANAARDPHASAKIAIVANVLTKVHAPVEIINVNAVTALHATARIVRFAIAPAKKTVLVEEMGNVNAPTASAAKVEEKAHVAVLEVEIVNAAQVLSANAKIVVAARVPRVNVPIVNVARIPPTIPVVALWVEIVNAARAPHATAKIAIVANVLAKIPVRVEMVNVNAVTALHVIARHARNAIVPGKKDVCVEEMGNANVPTASAARVQEKTHAVVLEEEIVSVANPLYVGAKVVNLAKAVKKNPARLDASTSVHS